MRRKDLRKSEAKKKNTDSLNVRLGKKKRLVIFFSIQKKSTVAVAFFFLRLALTQEDGTYNNTTTKSVSVAQRYTFPVTLFSLTLALALSLSLLHLLHSSRFPKEHWEKKRKRVGLSFAFQGTPMYNAY